MKLKDLIGKKVVFEGEEVEIITGIDLGEFCSEPNPETGANVLFSFEELEEYLELGDGDFYFLEEFSETDKKELLKEIETELED